jgi:hypothetical protein
MHGDWVTAIAAIVGAVIGVLGALLIEYFRAERKAVRFVIDAPEDLAAALRSRGNSFELKVNGVVTQTLIAAGVTVQNTGNAVITDLTFDVGVPGVRILAQAQQVTDNLKLASAIRIDEAISPVSGWEKQPLFKISLAYFNPGETFKVTTFFDGEPTRCTVNCRLPDVKIKITTEEDVRRRTAAREELGLLVGKLTGLGSFVAIAAAAAAALLAAH